MTSFNTGPARVRTGRRLTIAAASAVCVLALPGVGVAQAQSDGAAGAQYTVPAVTTPTATTPAPSDDDSGVADNGDSTSEGSGAGSGSDEPNAGNAGGTGSGSAPGARRGNGVTTGARPSGAGTTTTGARTPTPVDYAAFGLSDIDVRDDVRAALTRGGLQYRYVLTTDKKIVDFVDGSLAGQLSAGGARPVGRRTGQELTSTGRYSLNVFNTLFGNKFAFRPFTATVLTRGDSVSAKQVAFLRGLATGFGATVPTVYVERSDDKRTHVDEFENLPGVSVVDNIDTDAGKRKLVELLTTDGGAVPAATGGSIDAQTRAAIANVGDESSSSVPLLLLVLVLGGVVFTGGTLVRRRR